MLYMMNTRTVCQQPVCEAPEIPECPDCICPTCETAEVIECPECEEYDCPSCTCNCVTNEERLANPEGIPVEQEEGCYPLKCPEKYDYCDVSLIAGGGGWRITLKSGEVRYFGAPKFITKCEVTGKWFEK